MSNTSDQTETLVRKFVAQVVAAVEAEAARRIQLALARAFGASETPTTSISPGKATTAKPRKTSAAVSAARKLQGQYMGALRALDPTDRLHVKQVVREQGVAAGLKLALSLK